MQWGALYNKARKKGRLNVMGRSPHLKSSGAGKDLFGVSEWSHPLAEEERRRKNPATKDFSTRCGAAVRGEAKTGERKKKKKGAWKGGIPLK